MNLRIVNGVDACAIQNLEFAAPHFKNTISDRLNKELLREHGHENNGAIIFMTLMHLVVSDGCDAIEKCKKELKDIKLKDFNGESVENCCDKTLPLCEQLEGAEAFEPDLLCTIARIFEDCSEQRFCDWARATCGAVSN